MRAAILGSIHGPVQIENVQIENIDFCEAYEQSIEQRMLAEVEVQRIRQNAEREKIAAEIIVTRATAEANAVRQRALAESEAITLARQRGSDRDRRPRQGARATTRRSSSWCRPRSGTARCRP